MKHLLCCATAALVLGGSATAFAQAGTVQPGPVPQQHPLPHAARDSVYAFVGVNVVSMMRDTVLVDRSVIVRHGRIVAEGPRGRIAVPRGAKRIDGAGRWLMPGLVDAHVHTVGPASMTGQLYLMGLASGVTTAMVLNGNPVALELRDRYARGTELGPTLYVAAPLLDDSTMTTADGARLVREYKAGGYDLIKVYSNLSRAGFRGVMVAAHANGMPVVGHSVRAIGIEGVLGAGQRGIAHIEEYLYEYFGLKTTDSIVSAASGLDTSAIAYLAAITARGGAWVTPTLVTQENMVALAENLEQVLAQEGMTYTEKALRDALRRHGSNAYATKFAHPRQTQNLRESLAFQRRLLRAFHAAGVKLLTGTDAPIAVTMPGFGLHRELEILVEGGLSPFEALRAATFNAAEYLGQLGEFGTVEVGRRGDLLLLTANPLRDVRNARRIAGVMTRGAWLDSAAVAATLDALRRRAM